VDDGSAILQEKFDLISCLEVLEHVPNWQPLLKSMAESSKYLLLSFPTGRMRPFESLVGHVRNFRKGEVESVLGDWGMRPVKVWYAGWPVYSPLYRDVCQVLNIGSSTLSRGRYGFVQKTVSGIFYAAFRYGTLRCRGDQFCGVFERIGRD